MKRVIILSMMAIFVLGLLVSEAICASSVNVSANASVTAVLDVAATIKKHTDTDGDGIVDTGEPFDTVTSIAFGDLQRSTHADGTPGAMYSPYAFHVYLGANASSRQYKITQSGTVLTAGTNNIPDGAYLCTPAWAGDSANNDISGDALGTAGTAVGTRDVYTSNNSGKSATVEVVYGLSRPRSDGSLWPGQTATIPPDQAGGTYTSTVTFTIALR